MLFQLLTGALPAQYGLRTSGIIDITSIVNDGITGSKWFLVATQNHAAATGDPDMPVVTILITAASVADAATEGETEDAAEGDAPAAE